MNWKVLFLTCCIGFSVTAWATPNVEKKVEYYDVKGWDLARIQQEMNANGPVDRNSGNRVWAHTTWRVRWNITYAEESISCRPQSIEAVLYLEFVVPRWIERDKAPEAVQKKWDIFYAALQKHEQQHAIFGYDAAKEIEEALMAIPKKRLCSQVREEADAISEKIIRKHNLRDIELDAKTDHGRAEGVTF